MLLCLGSGRRFSSYVDAPRKIPDYWIDKYEVTNQQYKDFVAAGGYQNPRFWKQPFMKDGRALTFEQAMAEFKDATGRPGPAGWRFGSYPEGKEDFPVNGVSWYEAAAYAEFAGKSLPTTYHWCMFAFYFHDDQYMEFPVINFLMLSGRAVMFPVYKGTYERGAGAGADWEGQNAERDLIVQWSKDLGRSIDYLETRQDIDVKRLAFYGLSLGGYWGPIFTQVDQRFKASVLLSAGLSPWIPLPEVDAVNYLPRNHVPTLLIAGHDDYIVPVETNQKPLFRLLGTSPQDKRYVIFDSGHDIANFQDVIKEVNPWLDRYLGPVQTRTVQ